jgi:MFS transporter
VTFDLGTLLSGFFNVASGAVAIYIALFAVSNFLGPLLLGRLFDTVGRKPMIAGTYIGSAAVLVVLTVLFVNGTVGKWGFMWLLLTTFFLASAGASAAYLTVSEIFPMQTRALAIAFFYAIGTAIGGITGPLLFAKLIESGKESQVAIGFYLGAAVMAIGGVVEIFFGVMAEQRDLEDIATPLTAEEAEGEPGAEDEPAAAPETQGLAPDRPREAVAASERAGAPGSVPARSPPRPACTSRRRFPQFRSPAKSGGSSARWPSTGRPIGPRSACTWARARGAPAATARPCARPSPAAVQDAWGAPRSRLHEQSASDRASGLERAPPTRRICAGGHSRPCAAGCHTLQRGGDPVQRRDAQGR